MELLNDIMGRREFMIYLEKEFSGKEEGLRCYINSFKSINMETFCLGMLFESKNIPYPETSFCFYRVSHNHHRVHHDNREREINIIVLEDSQPELSLVFRISSFPQMTFSNPSREKTEALR